MVKTDIANSPTSRVSNGENPRESVFQANPLIQARKDFDLIGMRIFLLGLRGINPHFSRNDRHFDEKFELLFIPIAQLVEVFGGNTKCLHDLKNACKSLFNAIIELDRADGGFTLMHLFRRLEYIPREGLYLQFDELMRPFVLDLFESKGYTRVSIDQVFRLSSTYAIRLVELLLQYQNIAPFRQNRVLVRTMTVPEIRFALNVPTGTYEGRLDNFRKAVLDSPIREINAKTLYKMRYETLKSGKIVDKIRFFLDISALPQDESSQNLDVTADFAISRLRDFGFSEQAARAIFAKCDSPADCLRRLSAAKRAVSAQNRRGGVVNPLGYVRCHIEQNWASQGAGDATDRPTIPANSRTGSPTPIREILGKVVAHIADPPLPDSLVRLIKAAIARGDNEKSVELLLKSRNLTIEKFKILYSKNENTLELSSEEK